MYTVSPSSFSVHGKFRPHVRHFIFLSKRNHNNHVTSFVCLPLYFFLSFCLTTALLHLLPLLLFFHTSRSDNCSSTSTRRWPSAWSPLRRRLILPCQDPPCRHNGSSSEPLASATGPDGSSRQSRLPAASYGLPPA